MSNLMIGTNSGRKIDFYSLPLELICIIGNYLDILNLIKFKNTNKITRKIKIKSYIDNITFYNEPNKWYTFEESPPKNL